jgi:hypothetical protein
MSAQIQRSQIPDWRIDSRPVAVTQSRIGARCVNVRSSAMEGCALPSKSVQRVPNPQNDGIIWGLNGQRDTL